jgi:PAS domain-containing protein
MKNKLLIQTLLLGFSFPIIATIIQSFVQFSYIDFYSFIKCQYSNYLLWIIDSAPLVLFMFYKIIENKIKEIEQLNEELLFKNKHLEDVQFERELFSIIAQKTKKLVIVIDADEHIIWANKAFLDMFKLNLNDISRKLFWQVIKTQKSEEEKRGQIKKSIENKTQLEIEICFTTKNENTNK